MIRVIASVCAAFLIMVVTHFAYFHFFAPQEKVNILLMIALAGFLLFFFLSRAMPSEAWFLERLHISDSAVRRFVFPSIGALLYALLFIGYLEFYFTADRSITFRMLMITDEQPEHYITEVKMLELYDVPSIVVRRFDDLVYGGYFERRNNAYYLTVKGKIVLSLYKFTIEFLHLGRF